MACGIDGGACGNDVVDNEKVFALEFFGVFYTENVLHIAEALTTVFVSLGLCVGSAYEVAGADRKVEHLGNAATELFALIVTAL